MEELDKIVILGSGRSFLDLSENELKYIRRCKIRIGLNKYLAFYRKLNIIPTHVYLVDVHGNCLGWIEHFLNICNQDKLANINFIFDNSLENKFFKNKFSFYYRSIKNIIFDKTLKISKGEAILLKLKKLVRVILERQKYLGYFLKIPDNCKVEFVNRTGFLDAKIWASSFKQELFHYRTSFTSLLNYITIKYPKKHILLVATDFNSGKYFFQDELETMKIDWKDFTSDLSEKNQSHYSIQDYQNSNLLDKMAYIISKVHESGNEITCLNSNSILVTKGFVQFQNL
jgi:hypothetical protein